MSGRVKNPAQLGFDQLLVSAAQENRKRALERRTAHLPKNMEGALVFFHGLIREHHAAMMAADIERTMELRAEAHDLALKLNAFEPGILAHDDAPGCVLANKAAAPYGETPLWGQQGAFILDIKGMKVRIEMDGLFGIGASVSFWPGFAAHAVERERPFLSPTGYRSFLGIAADPCPGLCPDNFTANVIGSYVREALNGRLVEISPCYRSSEYRTEQ